MPTRVKTHKRRGRQHRLAAPLGGAFVLLAVIGAISIVIWSIQLTRQLLDNSREKERFETLILPVVMFDPVPFDSPGKINDTELLLYSMWAALTNDKAAIYGYSESQELIVPASDLDVAASTLFGEGITLEHKTFGDYDMRYTYDAENKVYYVPTMVQLYLYSPEVEDITRDGDYYSLMVSYIPPGNVWTTSFGGRHNMAEADKQMIYVMEKSSSGWHIVMVQDPPSEGDPVIRS